MKVGWIGLGIMGRPMARNLMRAGHELVVHSRSGPPVDELVAEILAFLAEDGERIGRFLAASGLTVADLRAATATPAFAEAASRSASKLGGNR